MVPARNCYCFNEFVKCAKAHLLCSLHQRPLWADALAMGTLTAGRTGALIKRKIDLISSCLITYILRHIAFWMALFRLVRKRVAMKGWHRYCGCSDRLLETISRSLLPSAMIADNGYTRQCAGGVTGIVIGVIGTIDKKCPLSRGSAQSAWRRELLC